MKTIALRFVNDGKPTGWIGMASAKDWLGLYWVIDEFGDPSATEYQPLTLSGGVCWQEEWEEDDDPKYCGYSMVDTETSELMPNTREGKWKTFPIEKCTSYKGRTGVTDE